MKYISIFIALLISYCLSLISPHVAFAIVDPLATPNNKIGIHILFPQELSEAAALVNSNNGEWGYVTIPIQAGDRDLEKWQAFMDEARRRKVIPLIRLATEGDYFNTKVWRKPTEADVVDFANFLNSLEWPTKNRYIIVFNEVNRSDEWGGATNPFEYAPLLQFAVQVFKQKSDDFFIISAGMDNAAGTVVGQSYNQYTYFTLMNQAVPSIFDQIDGFSSHSYPNPGFSQPPSVWRPNSIGSFQFEAQHIGQFSTKRLPIFITETGWSKNKLSEDTISNYLQESFTSHWNTDQIVTVTPFLLRAGAGSFVEFSFLNQDGGHGKLYKTVLQIPKTKGKPVLSEFVLGVRTITRTIKEF